jgi:hypothetical protein
MAITTTTTVSSINVIVLDSNNYAGSALALTLVDTMTNSEDADFEMKNTRRVNLASGADVSSYPQFVQDVAAIVWS